MVEHYLAKVTVGVRFSSLAPFGTLAQRQSKRLLTVRLQVRILHVPPLNAYLAQLAAQLTCNQQVIGSIPIVGTIYPDLVQLGSTLVLGTRGHRFKSCSPDHIRTCTYFFAQGAAVCWFKSSLPDHYREVGKLVKPAIISQVIFLLISLKIILLQKINKNFNGSLFRRQQRG